MSGRHLRTTAIGARSVQPPLATQPPSSIDNKEPVSGSFLRRTYEKPDNAVFRVEAKPDFKFTPVKGSFNKSKCSVCGEYVFDRYVRIKDGQPVCIPCSGY